MPLSQAQTKVRKISGVIFTTFTMYNPKLMSFGIHFGPAPIGFHQKV